MPKFEIPENPPAKQQITARLSPAATQILLEMTTIYATSQAKVIEGLLTTFGPGAIKEAKAIKTAARKLK